MASPLRLPAHGPRAARRMIRCAAALSVATPPEET